MKNICLYLKIHQPFRLKRYRFFDIGNDHYYYDDFANEDIVSRIARQSYIPLINTLGQIIRDNGNGFKCALSISGTAIEQLQLYMPEVIELLKNLCATGCIEILSGTYSHSLSSLQDPEEFFREVNAHDRLIRQIFGLTPTVFANTELIYDDDLALLIGSMGFKACLTDGAKHILGWKSPNYIYASASNPSLSLLLTNDKLAEDISARFARTDWDEYPLTADKYISWINALPKEQQIINLYFSMDTFGSFLPASTGIFEFLKALPRFANDKGITFASPSDALAKLKPVSAIGVPYPLSSIDEARDVSAWKGNSLQREALDKLYSVAERVNLASDRRLLQDWKYLQNSDHFFYMSTKKLEDGASHAAFSPYDSPFAAFTNYMNVLADFLVRVEEQFPSEIENEELNALLLTIRNQASEIEQLKKEIKQLHNNIVNADDSNNLPQKSPAKKTTTKPSPRKKK